MPNDLQDMIDELIINPEAFAIGLYPITDMVHTRVGEMPVSPTRILVWKVKMFRKCLIEFQKRSMKTTKGLIFDELYRIAEIAIEKKYKCLISRTARPQRLHPEEFKTMVLG